MGPKAEKSMDLHLNMQFFSFIIIYSIFWNFSTKIMPKLLKHNYFQNKTIFKSENIKKLF